MGEPDLSGFDPSAFWDLPPGCALHRLENGGYNNHLYRVYLGDQALPFVLRVYGNHANPRYIQHEIAVLAQLARRELPFSVPLPLISRQGEFWALVTIGRTNHLMVLLPFIPGCNPDVRNLRQAEGAAEALANLHLRLTKVEPRGNAMPRPYIELDRVHPLVPDPTEALRSVGSLATPSAVARVDAMLALVQQHNRHIRALPQQLIHGDFIPGNVLMQEDRVTGVLDFENCALNPRAMDFAIALDAWCWDALGSGDEWARIEALARGYSRQGRLSAEECALLPTLILLRNLNLLMHLVGRFLANLSPYADVAYWLDAMFRVDAWLTLNARALVAGVSRHMSASGAR